MGVLVPIALLALFTLGGCVLPDAPKGDAPDYLLNSLPPEQVAAGMFEKWQEAGKKPSIVSYTRVEYDQKAYWVAVAQSGYGDPPNKVAVYAPTKDGSFRRCMLAGPIRAESLGVAVDEKTGMLELREKGDRSTKGEVVLSCNLKIIGVLP